MNPQRAARSHDVPSVLGRATYEEFAAAWPSMTEEGDFGRADEQHSQVRRDQHAAGTLQLADTVTFGTGAVSLVYQPVR
jgi:hypothetical protein